MSTINVNLGMSGAGKTQHLYNSLLLSLKDNPNINHILIVPEQYTLQTQKDLVNISENKVTFVDVMSYQRLAYNIYNELGLEQPIILDDMAKNLIISEIIENNKTSLPLIGVSSKKKGYVEIVKSAISEFMQYGIGPDNLDTIICSISNCSLRKKLLDIKTIYTKFLKTIDGKYETSEHILKNIASYIHLSEIIKNSKIYFDGFTGFTPHQKEVAARLSDNAIELTFSITGDVQLFKKITDPKYHYTKNSDLLSMSEEYLHEISQICDTINFHTINSKINRFSQNNEMSILEKSIFRSHPIKYCNDVNNLTINISQTPKEEIEHVAREINRLIISGYKYNEIALVVSDTERYADFIMNSFSKNNIPCFMDSKRSILSNVYVKYICTAIEVMLSNFSAESVFRHLHSGIYNLETEQIDILENYTLALGIRGYSMWNKKWIRKYKTMEYSLDTINEIKDKCISNLLSLHNSLSSCKETKDYTYALCMMALNEDIPNKLMNKAAEFNTMNNFELEEEYRLIYEAVNTLYNKIVVFLPNIELSLNEYYNILVVGFNEFKMGVKPSVVDQVIIGDIERTRLHNIKVLFFVGLNNDVIPKASSKSGLLSSMERDEINELGYKLSPGDKESIFNEKYYLYLNMTKPSEKLFMSLSRVDNNNKSIGPAYLLDEINEIFPKLRCNLVDTSDIYERISNPLLDLEFLTEQIRMNNCDTLSPQVKELLTYYKIDDKYTYLLDNIIDAVFYSYEANSLTYDEVCNLYGQLLENNVTRLEKYATCPFTHFIEYGLHLKERRLYQLTSKDIGIVFHSLLDKVSTDITNNYHWESLTAITRSNIINKAIEQIIVDYENTIFSSSAKNTFLVERIRKIADRTIWALSEQVKRSDIKPNGYEVSFEVADGMDSINFDISNDINMKLSGRIDRIDRLEDNNKIYVKVIDYKSGSSTFDLVSLYNGLQLQLGVYMNVAIDAEKKRNPGKEIIPAALLYYNIKDPLIDKVVKTDINEKLLQALKMNGVVNSDLNIIQLMDNSIESQSSILPIALTKSGELNANSSVLTNNDFELINSFVKSKIKNLATDIFEGKAEIQPYKYDKKSACEYCSYKSICKFDEKLGHKRNVIKSNSKNEIIEKMK